MIHEEWEVVLKPNISFIEHPRPHCENAESDKIDNEQEKHFDDIKT